MPPGRRRQPTAYGVLAIATFGAFLAFLDSTIVNVIFPGIRASFPLASLATLSWVLNGYNIVFAAFLVAAGRLADVLGRRRLFIAGVALFVIASAACAAAGSAGQLIGFRLVQGLGAALMVPTSLALVMESWPPQRLSHGAGLWGAAGAVAAGLGPPLGGVLVTAVSWRFAFLVNVPVGVVVIILARRGLVESRAPGRRRMPDGVGALLLAGGLGLLTFGIVKGAGVGWASPWILGSFAAAAGVLAVFAIRDSRHPAPVLEPTLLRNRQFTIGNMITFVAGAGYYAYALSHIFWLRYVWHYSLLQAGFAVAPGALAAAAVAAVLGRVVDRRGYRPVVVVGGVVWALALGWWYAHRVGVAPDFVGQWLPGQLLSGAGVGATLPIAGSAALAGVPGRKYATASAVVSSTRQLGAVLGVAVIIAIIGRSTAAAVVPAIRHGWEFSAGCFALAAAGGLFLRRRRAELPAQPADQIKVPSRRSAEDSGERLAAPEHAGPAPRAGGLAGLRLLAGLPDGVLHELEQAMADVTLAPGQWLFRQGDQPDGLYVISTGQVEVTKDGGVIRRMGSGGVVGELGLLSGQPRSASVRARRETRLAFLSSRKFAALASRQPAVPLAFARALASELQLLAVPEPSTATASVIAVVAEGESAPAAAVSAAVMEGMRRHVRVVDPGKTGGDGLHRAEMDHDRVVLTAGWDDQRWRESCLRVADRVVLVTVRAAPRAEGYSECERGADLVFAGETPAGADIAAWCDAIGPVSVHVVGGRPMGQATTPLAARLANRSIGLVLAGGGARAFAHLGVLEELEAAGVAVDRVAGTSAGAVIAAMYAMGMDAAGVDAAVHEEFVRRNPLNDYTIPRHGLTRGLKALAAIRRRTEGRVIEELPREFRCVSVDLLRRRPVVHSRGPLADAVMASLRLPGLFAPYELDGSLHVDGGLMDNVPVSSLSQHPEGPIIAVNISSGQPPGRGEGPVRMPTITETLMRTMLMGGAGAVERALAQADVVIQPRSEGVGLLEWHQIDVMREAGRRAARAVMPEIIQLAFPAAVVAATDAAGVAGKGAAGANDAGRRLTDPARSRSA